MEKEQGAVAFKIIIIIGTILMFACSIGATIHYNFSNFGYKNLSRFNNLEEIKSYSTLERKIDKGTNYVFFGESESPWCQMYIPYYNNYAKKNDTTILYVNTKNFEGYKEKTGTESSTIVLNDEYNKFVNWILKNDPNYENGYIGTNTVKDSFGTEHEIPWLMTPRLFKVVDGQIVEGIGYLEGHVLEKDDNDKYFLPELTDIQKNMLIDRLNKIFE